MSGMRSRNVLFAVWIAVTFVACSLLRRHDAETLPEVKLVAVLPLERDETPRQGALAGGESERPPLAADAEKVVTAQVYAVLAESPRWRFVPDLTVEQALHGVSGSGSNEERARMLAEAVHAEGVFYGSVWRLREREGSEYGSRHPASVAFRLALYSVASGRTVWRGEFDQTQEPLSSNLLNWWQFWRAGPRWFTAAELARLGIEKLIGQLESRLK
ncbi:MAG TPA: hypothetical protein VL403_16850 [Candidatus Kryptonia bacterium]|nr:hypothetical protein [Candidatus Kryptonia bacterium]